MHIHESYKESVIRVYEEPDGYAKRLPYIASCTIDYLSHDVAFISNMMGRINRATLHKIRDHLRKNGFITVMFERHGKMRVESL